MPSSHPILCRPLLLLPSISPSIRIFSSDSVLHMRGPSIGVSASASVLPMNTQHWSPLGWTGWNSLHSKELSRVFSSTTVEKHQFFGTQPLWFNMTAGKTIALTIQTFVGKVMSLLFNMLSGFVIAFLPRSRLASFNFVTAVTIHNYFGARENKIRHCNHFFPLSFAMGPYAMMLVF